MVSRILHVDDNERGDDYQSSTILAATVGGAKGGGKQVAEGAAGIGSSDRKQAAAKEQASQVAAAIQAMEGREKSELSDPATTGDCEGGLRAPFSAFGPSYCQHKDQYV